MPEHHPAVRQCHVKNVSHSIDVDSHAGLQATWGVFKASTLSNRSSKRKCEWPAKHHALFKRHGIDWALSHEPSDKMKLLFPGLLALSSREFDVLSMHGVSFPESHCRFIELSQSCDRHRKADGAGAVIPNIRRYISSRCRLLTGTEAMHLQSLWFEDEILSRFDNRFLCDLAGNAFEASCCSSVIFCGLLLVSTKCEVYEPFQHLALREIPSDSESDGELELRALWTRPKHRR